MYQLTTTIPGALQTIPRDSLNISSVNPPDVKLDSFSSTVLPEKKSAAELSLKSLSTDSQNDQPNITDENLEEPNNRDENTEESDSSNYQPNTTDENVEEPMTNEDDSMEIVETDPSTESSTITEEECLKDSAACFIRRIKTGVRISNPTYDFESAPAYLQTKKTMQKISAAMNEKMNRDLEWRRNLISADDDEEESLEAPLQKFQALPAPPPIENNNKKEAKTNEKPRPVPQDDEKDEKINEEPQPLPRDNEKDTKNAENLEKQPKISEKSESEPESESESESEWRVNPLFVAVPIVAAAAGAVVAWYPTQCLGIVDTYVRPAIHWLYHVVF